MCLLIALSGVVPGVPLLIAANRDEMYQRPADPITVLRPAQPRILGGRDELAGGTWLAVNEHGVVAGLTNQPTEARDPAKRSRGELPLAFAAYPDAKTAVTEVCARLDPADYNPCWMLVGDRHALFS
ncbi:MAG TPA: NRDE family protein, partial [Streptosporangiaceae bacterium]